MKKRTAEIAGGGIAGLTMACCLAQRGWRVVLHERNAELREMGAALFLKVNSLAVLQELALLPEARRLGMRLRRGEIRDECGRALMSRSLPETEEAMTILRPELHRLLAEKARSVGVEIHTDSVAVGATPGGELRMVDGTLRRADLVVGADGVGSPVRDSLNLTRRLLPLQEGAIRVLAPRVNAEREGASVEYWSGDCRVGVVPCNDELLYLYLIGPHGAGPVNAVPIDKAFWKSRFPQVADIIDRIPPDAGRYDRLSMLWVNGWSRGRGCVIGDAAHAQPPNLGQGAGMSMANAAALAAALDEVDGVEAALAQWEAARRPVSEAVQRWSYRYGLLGYGAPARLKTLRSALVWTLGHTAPTARRWGYVWRGGHHSGEINTLSTTS